MPLRPQQPGHKLRVGDLRFLGGLQLLAVNAQHAPQLEILQQLFEFFSHCLPAP